MARRALLAMAGSQVPASGCYYPNGQLKELWTFSNGELDGPFESYL